MWYFRNALVRANYTNLQKGIYETTEYLEAFLRNLLLNEKKELHNLNLHISGLLNEEKVDIGDAKVDIENEKVDIQDTKVDIESILSEKGSDFSVKTIVHIHRLFEKFGFDEIFGRSAVMELLELKGSGASKSLIENNIPFITDKQVFLPFIGTMLTDEKELAKLTGKFVYSTQQLFLFYLYNKKKRLYISEAGKVLPFTAMTLTRAVKQLEATDLFLVAKDGVNKFIESK